MQVSFFLCVVMADWVVEPWTEDMSDAWDSFVLAQAQGSVHQVRDWRTLQRHIPGREQVRGFVLRRAHSTEIEGLTWCVRMMTGRGKTFWYYSARGPVFRENTPVQARAFFLKEVAGKLKEEGSMFWRFDPYWSEDDYAQVSAHVEMKPATQNYQPEHTLVLDITQSEDDILAQMKRKGRYNINLAQKKGVQITAKQGNEITQADIDAFWMLNSETTNRDGFSSHPKEYYVNFLRYLEKYAVLFLASAENTPVAAAITTLCGTKAIYYFGASTSDPTFRPLMAPYLLQWEMMQYAKAHGCTTYDFLGIAPEGEEKHAYAGISEFKWKFGGTRVITAPGREIVLRPALYQMYRLAKSLRG